MGDAASGLALGGAKRYSSIGGRFFAASISDWLMRRRADGQPDIKAVKQTCLKRYKWHGTCPDFLEIFAACSPGS